MCTVRLERNQRYWNQVNFCNQRQYLFAGSILTLAENWWNLLRKCQELSPENNDRSFDDIKQDGKRHTNQSLTECLTTLRKETSYNKEGWQTLLLFLFWNFKSGQNNVLQELFIANVSHTQYISEKFRDDESGRILRKAWESIHFLILYLTRHCFTLFSVWAHISYLLYDCGYKSLRNFSIC